VDVAALILAAVAVVVFFTRPVQFGLVLLTVALICQFVHLTGHVVTVH